ncbi:PREDICTED: trichohyalin-like [Acropora digitifera]|uniref:trichohyalin-like n=1 Tax=Acropora digitifera TaxID=70779 RepID=UPI00077AAB2B|nr:PREDICTED: trichohyalin-like [Acropora digitifera]
MRGFSKMELKWEISDEERTRHDALFYSQNPQGRYLSGEQARSLFIRSKLPLPELSKIWFVRFLIRGKNVLNMSDIDRDGKLSQDEFFVALHLTRFCKQGNSIEGSVNVRTILLQQIKEDCYETKKLRLAEVQTEKRKLLSLKEKLCHEIAGGLDEELMAQKVQDELDQVNRQIYLLEKDETELRRALQQLKDKSKRESFKPFDRSFLLKRHPSGGDIFRGASRSYKETISDQWDVEIQKLWKEDGDLSDFGTAISEDLKAPDESENNLNDGDQSVRSLISSISEAQELSNTVAMSSTVSLDINGNSDETKPRMSSSVDKQENNHDGSFDQYRRRATGEQHESQISDYDDKENKSYHLMNGSSQNSSTLLMSDTEDSLINLTTSVDTQENLIPIILEEKKQKDEERAKHKELNEELRRKAREELHKLDEETIRNAEHRKVVFEEEKRKLEHQTSVAQEERDIKKEPLTKIEAGKILEQEVEEQRLREALTRIELENIKERERIEQEKQKFKLAKKEEHPSAFQSTDLIQTSIIDDKGECVENGNNQAVRISSKRGSIVDLIEGDVKFEPIKQPVENRPILEPVKSSSYPQTQSQQQPLTSQHHQPVMRRTKDTGKPAPNRNAENRKSIIELEIERQREREEEMRREAELARRFHAKQQGDDKFLDKNGEETKPKEKKSSVSKPPSVQRKTEKFEKKCEELKAKEYRPKQALEKSTPAAKPKSIQQPLIEEDTVIQSKKVDVMQRRNENDCAESSLESGETEAQRKRREEKELFKQMQEEERQRQEAQRQDLERIRKEVDRREAEEMVRVKQAKEEEKAKQRELEIRMLEERQKESLQKEEKSKQDTISRKTTFAAHKLILEQRVLKALEESKQESSFSNRRASSFEPSTDFSSLCDTVNEDLTSGGVKLRKASFEKNEARKDSTEDMRKKRFSFNLDGVHSGMNLSEHAPSRVVQSGSMKEGMAHAAEDIKKSQAQDRKGRKENSNTGKLLKAKSLCDLSMKKDGKKDDLNSHPILNKPLSNRSADSVDGGFPLFSDSRIQRELEEQRMREAIVKQESKERERWYRQEEEKKTTSEPPVTGKKEVSLRDIKRNPLPNKIQVSNSTYSGMRSSQSSSNSVFIS